MPDVCRRVRPRGERRQGPHPSGNATQAYADIPKILVDQHDFGWRQGSLYTTEDEDTAKLFAAINDLKATGWFPACVRDIRAFRVEQ